MIRYHSFYPAHREREYEYLMNDQDREMFHWVRNSTRTTCTPRASCGRTSKRCDRITKI